MNKVVLVDDEMFVRKSLINQIDWKKCGFEVVGEAENGKDAFEAIKELKPDLVITDIHMPILNGLDMIKKIFENNGSRPKFIVMSETSEFHYIRQAIRYSVHDFILKNNIYEELELSLTLLSSSLSEEKSKVEEEEEIKKEKRFEHLIFGRVEEKEAQYYLIDTSIEHSKYFYYIIFEINEPPIMNYDIIADRFREIKQKLTAIIQDTCDLKQKIWSHELDQGTYGLLIPSSYLHRFQMKISKFIYWINEQLSRRIAQEVSFYIGGPVPELSLLKDSYYQAQNARQYKYLQREKNIIFSEEIEYYQSITYTELDDFFYSSLIEQMEEQATKNVIETIDKIFRQFSLRKMAQTAVIASINRFVQSILKVIKNMKGEVSSLKSFKTMLRIPYYNLTLSQLRELFLEFVMESKEEITRLRNQTANGVVNKIKQYVDFHYQENISLKTIAAKYYIHPVYLGQLFKKTYGIYFKDYLLQVRINEAKKLLRQSELKVYEIAENVGFHNTDYFITIFGKLEKVTPSEYRNNLSKSKTI